MVYTQEEQDARWQESQEIKSRQGGPQKARSPLPVERECLDAQLRRKEGDAESQGRRDGTGPAVGSHAVFWRRQAGRASASGLLLERIEDT
jgi:hypothetical protein